MHNPHIAMIVNGITAAGAPVPKEITDAQNLRVRLLEAATASHGNHADVLRAWAEEVLAGRDPLESKKVLRAVIAESIYSGDVGPEASSMVEDRTVEAITSHEEQILEAFATAVDSAMTTLTEAHNLLGDLDLSDSASIFKLGSKGVEAHQAAMKAVQQIRTIDKAWVSLANITGFASAHAEFIDRFTDATYPEWATLRHLRNDVWALVRAGLTLKLATTQQQINERRATRDRQRTASEHAAEELFANKMRSIPKNALA